MKKQKLDEVFSEDFVSGLKAGLKIAKDVCEKQGYELCFPEVDEILVERENKKK